MTETSAIPATKPTSTYPYPRRCQIERQNGITSYNLSKQVSQIRGIKHSRKVVLRALADRYPNIWPSVRTLSDDTGLGTTVVRESLRDLEAAGIVSPVGNKKGGRGKSEQYVIDVASVEEMAKTQRIPLPLERKPNAGRCVNPTPAVAFIPQTQRISGGNPTRGVAEQRSNREVESTEKENREGKAVRSLRSESKPKPRTSNGYSPEEREALRELARDHDRSVRDEAIAQLVTDEMEVLDNLPAELIEWTEKQQPLDTPLIVVEAPSTGDGLCLPYTENGHEYTEATACENRERAVNILYGGEIKDRTQLLIDYDLVWQLDIAYGQGACLGLAIMVSELCLEHRSFIYHHLGNLMVEKARSPKPETEPVRKMDVDTEDGDVSELDAIPELDLATTPELDLSNVPVWTS